MIHDNYLSTYSSLREYADTAQFKDVVSPVDGVIYPTLCTDIPQAVVEEISSKIGTPKYLFMRLSLKGNRAPHQAHTDSSMGGKSLMLYLNRQEHCRGGTSLVRHIETGLMDTPHTEAEEALWKRDTNNPDAWKPWFMCPMSPNRAFIFDADLMHRAEPLGGFGTTPQNGRLVLTAFF